MLCAAIPLPALAHGAAAPSVFSAYVGEATSQPGAEPPHPCSAFCCPEQDGTCKFQPKQAVAFVKDVANITIVSTGQMRVRLHLPGGQWARQGSLSGQHTTGVRVTVAMRAAWRRWARRNQDWQEAALAPTWVCTSLHCHVPPFLSINYQQ